MSKFRWMISGVGRSGTTMAYNILLSAARAERPSTLGRYEPFLWGEPTWDKLPGEFGDTFSRTNAINPHGIVGHLDTPIFLSEPNPELEKFTRDTFPKNRSFVAKTIRGAGRLSAFLAQDPDLRIVHLIRNPLDVVNSALVHFSFFGSEFHPSDEPRFNIEARARFGELHRPTTDLTEAERSLEWWRLMNEAALQSAEVNPDRLKIVSYEQLMNDKAQIMADIISFLGGDGDKLDNAELTSSVGPVTGQISLNAVDRDAILPHLDAYFEDRRIFKSSKQRTVMTEVKGQLLEKYKACNKGAPHAPQIDRDVTPTQARIFAAKAQYETHLMRKAGDKQLDRIAEKIFGQLEQSYENRDKAAEALVVELQQKKSWLATKVEENQALIEKCRLRDSQIAELNAQIAVSAKTAKNDLESSRNLIGRLRDRIDGLRYEQVTKEGAFEKLRLDMRSVENKLRKTEKQLQNAASEREHYRQQVVELASIIAPRLGTIAKMRPLRYVLRQRQRMKAGIVEADENGYVGPKTK